MLPLVFAGFAPSRQINILDLGSAEPESVAFYQRYDARVCIINVVDELAAGFSSSLYEILPDSAKGICFDICLCWDCLNFLSKPAMADFARDIAGYLHQGSRIHAIAAYTPSRALDACRYAIDDHDRILIKPRSRTVPHPHAQTGIERALPGFRIQRTVLRAGNRLELLLTRRRR